MNEEIILKKFAERLTYLVKEHQTDIILLANKLGIKSKSTIYRYMNGEMSPKITTVKYLAEFYNVNPTWLMGYDVPMERERINFDNGTLEDIVQIPVYGKISAGQPLEMVENIIDYTFITAEEARKGSYFALEVNGDSMDKIIPNGSRVVVRKQEELENGQIGVIVVNGYDATIKRYERDNDMVFLYPESNNPEHRVQRYNLKETPITILGKVESFNKKI